MAQLLNSCCLDLGQGSHSRFSDIAPVYSFQDSEVSETARATQARSEMVLQEVLFLCLGSRENCVLTHGQSQHDSEMLSLPFLDAIRKM